MSDPVAAANAIVYALRQKRLQKMIAECNKNTLAMLRRVLYGR
jgi:hypothetical protein